jgi:insertion element IS1 protein InsB
MVTIPVCCHYCGSKDVVRNGHASNGKQKYRCKSCQRQSRENPANNGYTQERREEILRSSQERSSLRGLTRTFGVARNTVKGWLKKTAAELPPLSEPLVKPDANDPEATTLELDELWSFVFKKENNVWVWIALCRKTRPVVSRAVGDRSKETCQMLWDGIPPAYRAGHCFSDFWNAYQAIIAEEQLTQVGKETGETAHVERWNGRLRQRSGPFIRKTLSFSKSTLMHIACWDLFLHRYNLERTILLV